MGSSLNVELFLFLWGGSIVVKVGFFDKIVSFCIWEVMSSVVCYIRLGGYVKILKWMLKNKNVLFFKIIFLGYCK